MSHKEIAQRSTRGSFALFAGTLGSTLISAVTVIIIARLLGPSEYGTYTLVLLIPGILLNFLGLGVSSGITRYAAYYLARKERETAKRMTINGLVFLLSFGVLLSAACYLGAAPFSTLILHRSNLTGLVQFASLYVLAQALFTSGMAALLGWSYMGQMGITYTLQASVRLVLAVGLVVVGFGVAGALGGYSASLAVTSIAAIAVLWTRMRTTREGGRSDPPTTEAIATPAASSSARFVSDIKTMLGYGWALFVGQVALSLSSQYVVAVLAAISTNAYVGYYQSAVNVTVAITVASSAITQALFPAFTHLEGTRGDTSLAFMYATKYMSFVLGPIILLLMAAASTIMSVLYPSSYSQASIYLVLLSLSNITLLLGYGVLPSFFNGVGRPRLYMTYSIANAAAQFVLAPLLGIYAGLGIQGLIYSVLAANLIGSVVGLWLASKHLRSRIDARSSLSILTASTVSYLVVYAIDSRAGGVGDVARLVLDICVFSLVYLTLAPIVRAIRPGDVNTLEVALGGLGRFRNVLGVILKYEAFVLKLFRVS